MQMTSMLEAVHLLKQFQKNGVRVCIAERFIKSTCHARVSGVVLGTTEIAPLFALNVADAIHLVRFGAVLCPPFTSLRNVAIKQHLVMIEMNLFVFLR